MDSQLKEQVPTQHVPDPGSNQASAENNIGMKPGQELFIEEVALSPEDEQYVKFISAGKGTEDSPYLIDFPEDDPENPRCWSTLKRYGTLGLLAVANMGTLISSSVFSSIIPFVIEEMKVNSTVATLPVSFASLFLHFGMLLWSPMSETYGRKPVMMGCTLCGIAFSFGVQYSKNIEGIVLCRMIQAFFLGSIAPNMNGMVGDAWTHHKRGYAIMFYGTGLALATPLGPLIGDLIVSRKGATKTDVMWFVTAYNIFMFLVAVVIPESYPLVLLRRKAKKLTAETGHLYQSSFDFENKSAKITAPVLARFLSRPIKLMVQEPIILTLGIYMSITTGLQSLFLTAFPIVFGEGRHWSEAVSGLSFMGMGAGSIFGLLLYLYVQYRYVKMVEARGGVKPPPESRLGAACVASCIIPVSLFWFAWTSSPSIHWMASMSATFVLGAATTILAMSIYSYIIDCFVLFASSAVSACNQWLGLLQFAFPLCGGRMYKALGANWGSTVVAIITTVLTPLMFVFYFYGRTIRGWSKRSQME